MGAQLTKIGFYINALSVARCWFDMMSKFENEIYTIFNCIFCCILPIVPYICIHEYK